MKKSHIIFILSVSLWATSCYIYKPYQRPEVSTDSLYRQPETEYPASGNDSISMGDLLWEEVFTDPYLQDLIRQGLEYNADLRTAALRVREAEASLLSARLAYTPSLALAPQGGVSSFEKHTPNWTYTLPATSSWEIDIFGRLLNSKRGAKAAVEQSDAYRQAVRTSVIATVANMYYTLLMLDEQLDITLQTSELWKQNVETMVAMKEAGMVNEAAVVQSRANSYMVEASIPDLKQSIRETENSLSTFLGQVPQSIERGTLDAQLFPEMLDTGIPALMLSNRPDVRAAETALAQAYYATNVARAAFYPSLSLTGTFGWTNEAGAMILNPANMIASAVGSLVAPIFNKGLNTARLRIAKAQQQETLIAFQQTLLDAGAEVSNALYQYTSVGEKITSRENQIKALEQSVEYTQQLLTLGSSTYLEVLTAQQQLLSARLSVISDRFQRIQAVVNLYHALGGGRGESLTDLKR